MGTRARSKPACHRALERTRFCPSAVPGARHSSLDVGSICIGCRRRLSFVHLETEHRMPGGRGSSRTPNQRGDTK